MVRFCDREVVSVEYNSISRKELLHYFLSGHLEEIVCICDEYGYVGYTTYHMLLQSISLEVAIIRDVLVLNESIWADAKKLFLLHKSHVNKHPLLPVIDQGGDLISFAYEDDDANRELRQLQELRENQKAVQFVDMYPDCDYVVIYGFNELAYFFACYLKEQGIPVLVEGAMWEGFFVSDNVQVPEYRCMKIYAEGIWEKPVKWEENLLRTVSVEFECVDKIYEENIKRGYINNAFGNCEDMLQRLKSAEAVAILGLDIDAQDCYDFLLQKGIKADCFVILEDNIFERKLFGKSVYSMAEAITKYGNSIVIVDNHHENSAWGMGRTDYFEHLGYRRNEGYILLKDYTKISGNSLRTALKGQKIALVGDAFLCERVLSYFRKDDVIHLDDVKYIMLPEEEKMTNGCLVNIADIAEICPDSLCLIILPEYFDEGLNSKYKQAKEYTVSLLRKYKLINYTDYFSFMWTFIDIEKEAVNKYPSGEWGIKRIVLGSIESCSGNDFFRQLLDDHPSIMSMYDEHFYLSCRLFWYCVRLAGKGKEEIVSLFGKWCLECQTPKFDAKKVSFFMETVCKYLKNGEKYTSQELFVIFHAALLEKDKAKLESMIIYWEPHHMPRKFLEKCVLWLGAKEVPCDIVNVVRNIYITKGSRIKLVLKFHWEPEYKSLYKAIGIEDIKKEEYEGSNRLVVRFEDLKCRPQEELERICGKWGMPWSDSLLETTMNGKIISVNNGNRQVQGFDLEPVYNQYEEYFSEFDRFRITLLCAPWQRKYGYPYVDINSFSRSDLQEMFLKKFRFADMIDLNKAFESEKRKVEFLIDLQSDIRRSLQYVWMWNLITLGI